MQKNTIDEYYKGGIIMRKYDINVLTSVNLNAVITGYDEQTDAYTLDLKGFNLTQNGLEDITPEGVTIKLNTQELEQATGWEEKTPCIQGDNADEIIADMMNAISHAIEPFGYMVVGHDNTDVFWNVLIDKM